MSQDSVNYIREEYTMHIMYEWKKRSCFALANYLLN